MCAVVKPFLTFSDFVYFLIDGGFFFLFFFFTGIKKKPVTWYWVGQKLHSAFSVPSYRKPS